MKSSRLSNPGRRALLAVLFRQKKKVVTLFSLTFLPIAIWAVLEPTIYTATAKLLLRPQASSLSLGEGVIRLTRDVDLKSELEILKSRGVIDRVCEEWERRFSNGPEGTHEDSGGELRGTRRRSLLGRLTFDAVEGANLITIRCISTLPSEAAFLANAVARSYLDYRVEVHPQDDSALARAHTGDRPPISSVTSPGRGMRNPPDRRPPSGPLSLGAKETASPAKGNERNVEIAAEDNATIARATILESAVRPAVPKGPPRRRNIALALLLGICTSFGGAFIAELLDDTFLGKEDVEACLHLPVLASFSDHSDIGKDEYV
jgi:uncharacterized protein involved in exopolysaccharide biosynthesis